MNPILFEQIRDKVKEVGVANMINDRLIELYFIDHKEKMKNAFDKIINKSTIYEFFSYGNEYGHHEFLYCTKGDLENVWSTNGGTSIQLFNNKLTVERWKTPEDINKFKIDNINSVRCNESWPNAKPWSPYI